MDSRCNPQIPHLSPTRAQGDTCDGCAWHVLCDDPHAKSALLRHNDLERLSYCVSAPQHVLHDPYRDVLDDTHGIHHHLLAHNDDRVKPLSHASDV